jgi:peroxiredoxin
LTPVVFPTLAVPPTSSVPRSRIGPYNGYYAPDFRLKNINGNVTTSLSDYEGQAVIIFFWATWCPYCKAEMPAMQMVYDAYKDKGLTVLAVDVGENASLGGSYRDAHALTFPILNDAGNDVASTYKVTAYPSHFFVDPSGVISSVTIGGLDYWALANKVKGMLNLP